MGMFDRLYDEADNEWQTKAFDCALSLWRIGDQLPVETNRSFQVEVLGEGPEFVESYATVRRGVLAAVPADRDDLLPLLDYYGDLTTNPNQPATRRTAERDEHRGENA